MNPADKRKEVVEQAVIVLAKAFQSDEISVAKNAPKQKKEKHPRVSVFMASDEWDSEGEQWSGELSTTVVVPNNMADMLEEISAKIFAAFQKHGLNGAVDGITYGEWESTDDDFDEPNRQETTTWAVWKHASRKGMILRG